MIVSVHIPKTAGRSFQHDLAQTFGERLLADYGDWPEITTPEGAAHNERRRAAMLAEAESIAERYNAIHGHFTTRKYANAFPVTALVTIIVTPTSTPSRRTNKRCGWSASRIPGTVASRKRG